MTHKLTYEELEQKITKLESQISASNSSRHASVEAAYRNLFQHMVDEVHVWELVRDEVGEIQTWRLLDANPAALKSWGMLLSNVVGKTIDEIFPGTHASELFMPVVRKVFSEGKPHSWEQFFPGTDQALAMVSVPFGECFVSMGKDISPIRQAQKQLNDSMLRTKEAVAAGNVGLWEWDLRTNEAYYSEEWKRQIGYESDEIANDVDEWKSRVHPDDLEKTLAEVNQSIEDRNLSHEVEFRFKHKNGSYRWILSHASVIVDESGKPTRMLGSHVDVTQMKSMQVAIRQSQKTQSLGTLVSGIAHDFNNLLGPMLGHAQLAKMTLGADSKETKYLERIETAAIRAKDLIKKILSLSQASDEKLEPIALDDLVKEISKIVQASAPKGLVIRHDLTPNLPSVEANSAQIYRVILNIFTNSIQAIDGAGEIIVELASASLPSESVSVQAEGKHFVCLRIGDNGCGMDAATLDRIFDPFFTTKKKGEDRGVGLGMSMVDEIIRGLGGHIHIESDVGRGTTFEIYLPACQAHSADETKQENAEPVVTPKHILFIDDEKALCEVGEWTLRMSGYKVSGFTDSRMALKEFEANPDKYGLVVTDYTMPYLSGTELIERIKQVRSDTSTLLITGHLSIFEDDGLDSVDCDVILEKPYEVDHLLDKVSELFG